MTETNSSGVRVSSAASQVAAELRAHRFGYALLLVLVAGAAWMRLTNLDDTSFLFDSARDLIWADQLLHQHRFPLLGPMMTSGGYLGPAMLYLIAPVGLISGDPEAFAAYFAASNVIAVVLAFYIGRRYFGMRAGLLGALLLGYNLPAVNASRGIWNPFLVPMFSALLTLALLRFFVDRAAWALIWMVLCLALLLQLHAHAVVLPVYCLTLAWLLPRPSVSPIIRWLALSVVLVVLVLPLLAFDVANDFYNARQILEGLRALRPAEVFMLTRAREFLTMNVFADRVFRSLLVLAAAVTMTRLWQQRSDPSRCAARLILLLPAIFLFAVTVLVMRFPVVPRFIQSLVVPSAILCGAVLDDLAELAGRACGDRPALVDGALLIAGILYAAMGVRAFAVRPREHGLGHLATIRWAVQRVIDDAQSGTVTRDNVFVCEDGGRDLSEYGRSYGYMIRTMNRAVPAAETARPTRYMISAFVQSDDHRIAVSDGVSLYRFSNLIQFIEFVRGFPGAVCHRAVAENFPLRTG